MNAAPHALSVVSRRLQSAVRTGYAGRGAAAFGLALILAHASARAAGGPAPLAPALADALCVAVGLGLAACAAARYGQGMWGRAPRRGPPSRLERWQSLGSAALYAVAAAGSLALVAGWGQRYASGGSLERLSLLLRDPPGGAATPVLVGVALVGAGLWAASRTLRGDPVAHLQRRTPFEARALRWVGRLGQGAWAVAALALGAGLAGGARAPALRPLDLLPPPPPLAASLLALSALGLAVFAAWSVVEAGLYRLAPPRRRRRRPAERRPQAAAR